MLSATLPRRPRRQSQRHGKVLAATLQRNTRGTHGATAFISPNAAARGAAFGLDPIGTAVDDTAVEKSDTAVECGAVRTTAGTTLSGVATPASPFSRSGGVLGVLAYLLTSIFDRSDFDLPREVLRWQKEPSGAHKQTNQRSRAHLLVTRSSCLSVVCTRQNADPRRKFDPSRCRSSRCVRRL